MRSSTVPSRASGFTLIEIMVVVVILGILASVIVPKIMDNPDKARVAKAQQDLRVIEAALNMYKLDNFYYPSTQQGLEALTAAPQGEPTAKNWKQGGYLPKPPTDPWGKPYQYLSPGTKGEIDIFSLGADGKLGGEGVAADIGNWNIGS